MIRQRLFNFATTLTMGVVFFSSTANAFAATAFSPVNTYSDNPHGANTAARAAQVFKLPYTATAQVGNKSSTNTFASLSDALAWAKSNVDAVVIDNRTGAVVFNNYLQPYAVNAIPAKSGQAVPEKTFATYNEAVNDANQTANSYVVDLVTGAILYNQVRGNFSVNAPSSSALFQNFPAALQAAMKEPVSNVTNVSSGQTVWKALYQVTVNGQFSQSFLNFADAKAYAEQNPQSEVINISTGKDLWDNTPRYDVYQNGILIKQFAYENDALTFAHGLSNVSVVDIATGQTVYTNMPNFVVEVGTNAVKSFVDEASAIAYAKTLSGAVVIQISNNQVVWSSAGEYGVYRYLQLVRSFNDSQDALSFAKTLDHVQVLDTQSNQVIYSNYPTNVKSPDGDIFTVQNGMVVDQWGAETFTWGPAPSFMTAGQTYVTEDYIHWYQVNPNGDTYVGQWENPYRTFNLMTPSSLTAAQINAFFAANAIPSSVLQNTGAYFIEAQQTYGVNAQYLVAHAIIESGWGTSYFAKNRDNLFGYEAYTSNPDAAATFRSIEYDINFEAWFVRNEYLDSNGSFFNGPNLDGMNVDYATDPYWANAIARRMTQIAPYSPSMANQPPMSEAANRTVFPYPPGAIGTAVSPITVYSTPLDGSPPPQVVGSIPAGSQFSVLGDTPGWDEVKLANNQTGFVDWNLVSLQNMLEVKGISYGSSLNLQAAAGNANSSAVVDSMPNGVYLVLANSANGWDYVVDGNGKSGWVNSQNVEVIH